MTFIDYAPLILVILVIGLFALIIFDQIEEKQKLEDFCEENGFQKNISKRSGINASRDYCIDFNGKLIEVICDTGNCYFLEEGY